MGQVTTADLVTPERRALATACFEACQQFIQRYGLPPRTSCWVSLPDNDDGHAVARLLRAPHVPRISEPVTKRVQETGGEFTFRVVPVGWGPLEMRLARAGLQLPPGVDGDGVLPGR